MHKLTILELSAKCTPDLLFGAREKQELPFSVLLV